MLRKSNRKREYIFGIFIHRTITCVVGTLNTTKGLLKVLFELSQQLKQMELDFDFTSRLVYTEELKDFPYSDVWNYFCLKNNVPVGLDWLKEVHDYEAEILKTRG